MHVRRYLWIVVTLLAISGCGGTDPGLEGSGTWRVVNYWALWCTPCREEIPELNRLHQQPDINVLGVNFDRKSGEELAEHRRQLDIRFPSMAGDAEALLGPMPRVLPTTLIINPQGDIVSRLAGPQTESQLVAALASHGRVHIPVIVGEKGQK